MSQWPSLGAYNGTPLFARVLVLVLFPLLSFQLAGVWHTSKAEGFTVQTASSADQQLLPQVFRVLQQARKDLQSQGYSLPPMVHVVIHPNLESFIQSTHLPWFVLASSFRGQNRIQTQRLKVVNSKSSLEATIRHELFHLAQPENWPRWKAEGHAMLFAGEKPTAKPLQNISEAKLESLLAHPPDRASLLRAVSTAYAWVINPK